MWAKLDDHYHDNPKILLVSFAARWLHTAAISWCSEHLTDGVIPRRQAWKLVAEDETCRPAEWIQELVGARLFEVAGPDSYLVHDYLRYNPTRVQVLEQRAEQERLRREFQERQQAAGEARAASSDRGERGRFTSRTTSQATSRDDHPAGEAAGEITSQPTSRRLEKSPASPPADAGEITSQPTSVNPFPVNPLNPLTRLTREPAPAPEKDTPPPAPVGGAVADAPVRVSQPQPIALVEVDPQPPPKRRQKPEPAYSAQFLVFWARWPRKVAKEAAWDAWQRMDPPQDELHVALDWQIPEWDRRGDPSFVPHASSYLNQRRWRDERPARASPVCGASAARMTPFETTCANLREAIIEEEAAHGAGT